MGTFAPIRCDSVEDHPIHSEYIEEANEHERKVRDAEITVVGVNRFADEEEDERRYPVFETNMRAADQQSEKIAKVKRERDNGHVQQCLESIKTATMGRDNVMPAVVEAVKAYATLGEICGVWRDIYGLWVYPLNRF